MKGRVFLTLYLAAIAAAIAVGGCMSVWASDPRPVARIKPGWRRAHRRPTKHQQRNLDQLLAPWITSSIPSSLPTPAEVDKVPKKSGTKPVTAQPTGQRLTRGIYRKVPTCKE